MSSPARTPPDLQPTAWSVGTAVDLALRVVGGFLSVAGAVLTALVELFFAPVRLGGVLIGVSVLIAIAANVALSRFAYEVVGRTWAIALPALAWLAVMMTAISRTTEGDLLLTDNWVSLLLIFVGSLTFAVVGYRLILATGIERAKR